MKAIFNPINYFLAAIIILLFLVLSSCAPDEDITVIQQDCICTEGVVPERDICKQVCAFVF